MVSAAVFLGCIPRIFWGMAAFRSLTPIAVYGKVMALAGRAFIRPAG
jgi:hypothetical protein